jgi:hypothetical protein
MAQSNPYNTPIRTRISNISHETQIKDVPAFILADSAYPNRTRIVTTFRNTDCHRDCDIKRLNAKLAGICYCVENASGICKARFWLLNRPLGCAKESRKQLIYLTTAIFLHNFLINEGDELPEDEVGMRSAGVRNGDEDGDRDGDGDGEDHGPEGDEEEGMQPPHDILLRQMYWLNSRDTNFDCNLSSNVVFLHHELQEILQCRHHLYLGSRRFF